eukprot:2903696-Prymnesium_polylepis.1
MFGQRGCGTWTGSTVARPAGAPPPLVVGRHMAHSDDQPLVDRYGVTADSTLFIDRMPTELLQGDVEKLIAERGGGGDELVNVW